MFILFPDERKRALPQALSGMTTMIASSLGPTVGGYITESLSWHWLFLINLVPGVICAYVVFTSIEIDRAKPELLRTMDLWGLFFLAMFLGGFEYTLDEGPRNDWFADRSVAICALITAVGGLMFFRRTLSIANPIVDLHVFRNRNFALTSLVSTVMGISMFTTIFLTPLFLGQVRAFSPLQIGEVMMVQGVSMFITAPFVVRLQLILDRRILMMTGVTLVALSSLMNSWLTSEWGFAQLLIPQAMRGSGLITCFIPMTNLALGTLTRDEMNNASGLYNVTRNNATHWQAITESTRLSRAPVREALAQYQTMVSPQLGHNSPAGAIALLARQAQQQALTMTYGDMYLMLAISTAVTMLLVPFIERPRFSTETLVE
jgi:DHA2 family multidrug resistance protein